MINDIGAGTAGRRSFEPYEIARACKEAGVKFRINASVFNELMHRKEALTHVPGFEAELREMAEEVRPHVAGDMKDRIKFGMLDIVNSTPREKADVTLCFNVLIGMFGRGERKLAVKNIADSTKRGGYLVTDEDLVLDRQLKKVLDDNGFTLVGRKIHEKTKHIPRLADKGRPIGSRTGGNVIILRKTGKKKK